MNELNNKKLAVDSFNLLYQFITTIRQADGTLLTNSQGKVTSHISGLFFRVAKLLKNNIKLVFVFDGVAPDLKTKERNRRKQLKQDAQRKYDLAVEEGDIELMKKYASRTARLTNDMVNEAKELITAFGQPIIDAPSEGEAQAAYMAKKGDVYGLISQDTDGLLFGTPKLIKNLSITKKRKMTGKATYQTLNPEIVDLSYNLNTLGIDIEQLIVLAMLCGTDFNIGGIKGIGPKKGLNLIKKYKKDFNTLFNEIKWNDFFEYSWQEVYDTIAKMPITDDYELNWKNIDENKIYEILINKNEFSKERIESTIKELTKNQAQRGLSDFF